MAPSRTIRAARVAAVRAVSMTGLPSASKWLTLGRLKQPPTVSGGRRVSAAAGRWLECGQRRCTISRRRTLTRVERHTEGHGPRLRSRGGAGAAKLRRSAHRADADVSAWIDARNADPKLTPFHQP